MTSKTNVNAESVGEIVRKHRRAAGLSQAKLAQLVGVSQPTIAMLEKGATDRLGTGNLLVLAMHLGIDARILDPTLEGIYARAEEPERRCVVLAPVEAGWSVGGEKSETIKDRDLGTWLRAVVGRGFEVEIAAMPREEL